LQKQLPLAKLFAEGIHSPGGAAATKEIVVASEDANIQWEGERDGRPIVEIARDTTPRGFLHVLVDGARNHVDNPTIDEGFNSLPYS
jgi:hypothetical protein